RQLDLTGAVLRAADRIGQPGVGEDDRAALEVERRVAERAVVLLELPLVQDGVHRREHARGAEPLGRIPAAEGPRSHQLAGKGAVERGGHAFARYVADRDDQAVRLRRTKVVQVT